MSLCVFRLFDTRRTVWCLTSLLLCLTTLWLLIVPALAAESAPNKASRELTYLGRSGLLSPAPQAPESANPADEAELPLEPPPAAESTAEVPLPEAPVQVPDPQAPPLPNPNTDDGWMLLLVNDNRPLPEDFSAPALTDIGSGQQVDSRMAAALRNMLSDACNAGLHPIVCSSYRTRSKQSQLYERKVRHYRDQGYSQTSAGEKAAFWVARPDTSEHQIGLAVDIISHSYQILDAKQAKTAEQQWLMAHCAEYGFILRYPADKSAITHVGYEPWHYRYVGVPAATAMTEAGLCLEEYLAAK